MTPQQANEMLGYLNVKYGTFFRPAELAATERTRELIESGEIIEVRRAPAPTSEPGARDLIAGGALRQYRHNDGSEGFVFGYDKEITDRLLATPASPARITGLLKEALGWIESSAEPAPSLCCDLRKELGLPPASPAVPSAPLAPSFRPANSTGRNYDPAPLVAQASLSTTNPRQIPDNECVQGKCACPTTGCWKECVIRRYPLMHVLAAPALLQTQASPLVEDAQRIVAGKVEGCGCRKCNPEMVGQWFFLCSICGNKRCPHANDHRNECTDSNEPGQKGSAYESQGRATTGNATADDGKDK